MVKKEGDMLLSLKCNLTAIKKKKNSNESTKDNNMKISSYLIFFYEWATKY